LDDRDTAAALEQHPIRIGFVCICCVTDEVGIIA
jgi:hypothetical protein